MMSLRKKLSDPNSFASRVCTKKEPQTRFFYFLDIYTRVVSKMPSHINFTPHLSRWVDYPLFLASTYRSLPYVAERVLPKLHQW